ncbi:MAG: hypothetical protein LBF41_02980, partial [Deltaproteobacteria bacterium]|nr:hypothetical protein [Deltaproteobacteria bacterium]
MSDPAGTRESGRERDGETRSSGKGSSFRGTRAGILPLLLFFLPIFPVFSSCGGKAPPPEPYFVAAARDALTSGNEWYARGCPKESLRYFDDALVAARLSDRADLTVASMNSRAAALMA